MAASDLLLSSPLNRRNTVDWAMGPLDAGLGSMMGAGSAAPLVNALMVLLGRPSLPETIASALRVGWTVKAVA